jgi:ATP-dependent helicase Lhr and Lhr-like helicase
MREPSPNARVISPAVTSPVHADAQLDFVGNVENAAVVVSQLHRGEKRLVFCDSRSQAERLASLLRGIGTNTFVSHSSLSVDDRRQAERAFRESRDCVIVATSTLELGIDVGDLDRVIQLEAPTTVASFLQRLGRTGRRAGLSRNCLLLATQRDALIRSAALLQLWKQGYVEPLHPPPVPFPVAAQQIMATIRQEGAVSRRMNTSAICRALGESGETVEALMAHMLAEGILYQDSGVVGLGPVGERLFGAKNHMALMSVFDTPSLFQVVCGIEELGWVHPLSFSGFGQRPVVISLGGRSWEVIRLDEDRSVAQVRPTDERGRSRWLGGSRALSYTFCQAIRSLLIEEAVEPMWSKRAATEIANARSENKAARPEGLVLEADERNDRIKWWTFGGLRSNASLSGMLHRKDGVIPRFDNYNVEILGAEGLQSAEQQIRSILPSVHPLFSGEDPPGRVKFWECLPEGMRATFYADRFSDQSSALKALSQVRVLGTGPNLISTRSK